MVMKMNKWRFVSVVGSAKVTDLGSGCRLKVSVTKAKVMVRAGGDGHQSTLSGDDYGRMCWNGCPLLVVIVYSYVMDEIFGHGFHHGGGEQWWW
ncbi:hypothetical protein Hdeb2414_s0024g00650541 [Helianthus debilis subsp. tardiflorus]